MFENTEKKKKKNVSFQKQRVIVKVIIHNVLVFELVDKKLDFDKNEPTKRSIFIFIFFRWKLVKLGKLGRVCTNLSSVNSIKLAKPFDFTRNRVYLRVNTILIPKYMNSKS